jgi:acyl-coenzyme A thioesterase PaaI-like protein
VADPTDPPPTPRPSYPPPEHLLRDLAVVTEVHPGTGSVDTEVVAEAPITDAGRSGRGLRVGLLATLVDLAGASIALASVRPDWIATADLGVHLARPAQAGVVRVTARPLRIGTGTVSVRADIDDEEGWAGTAAMTFARIPGSATSVVLDERPAGSRSSFDPGAGFGTSAIDRMGLVLVEPGIVELEPGPYVRNSFGTINGGAAATTDLAVRYLAQTRSGTVRTRVRPIGIETTSASVEIDLVEVDTANLLATAHARASTGQAG